ncbi:hypothetical protein J3458_001434 [Metarhizium acridum]|uniref:uncharacterized protein n=1 Tax=Metarhizium acridum TaxID=92637 RepID=UPI001C6B970E|nr:hypothetical protein J3458_001434 [Metarhizium acridum]
MQYPIAGLFIQCIIVTMRSQIKYKHQKNLCIPCALAHMYKSYNPEFHPISLPRRHISPVVPRSSLVVHTPPPFPLLQSSRSGLPLRLPLALLEQKGLALAQHGALLVVDALQPVSERAAAQSVRRVRPQRRLVEEGAHLDSDLPEAHGEACIATNVSFLPF